MAETGTAQPFNLEDRVIVDPGLQRYQDRGVVFLVKRILKVNVVIEPENGGRQMRINPAYLLPAPEKVAAVEVVLDEPLLLCAVVRADRAPAGAKIPRGPLFVVLGEKDGGLAYKLGCLGGSNTYWPKVPRSWLTVVPIEAINR